MKFSPPKFSWPKAPRLKLKASRLRLPTLKFGLPQGGLKSRKALFGAGVLGVLALGGLAWFVVLPMARPKLVAAPDAQATETAAQETKRQETKGQETKAAEAPAQEAAAKPPGEAQKAEGGAQGKDWAPPETPKEAAALAPGPPPPSEAETLVRRLQDVEERVAGGDAAAYAEMPRLVRSIALRFVAAPAESWAEPRNARALVLYLLSGGNSALGRKILGAHTVAPSELPLAKGAIAYLDGVDCAERDALLDVDPRALDPALGAQVAFVQSILLANYDRARAVARLDLARLLAPGGLVEEAALRREVGLLSETANFDKFAELARQYWSRFRRSPYAENFRHQFIAAIARVSVLIKTEQWAQFDEFIDSLSPERRRLLYLVMARTAAVAANSAFADLAARRAQALAAPDSVDLQRALLYRAAANIGGPEAAHNAELLRAVARNRLPVGDQPLFDAVVLVSARVFAPPPTDFAAPPAGAGDLAGGEFGHAEAGLRDADVALVAARQSMGRGTR